MLFRSSEVLCIPGNGGGSQGSGFCVVVDRCLQYGFKGCTGLVEVTAIVGAVGEEEVRFSPKRAVRVVGDVFGQTPNGLLAIAFQSGVACGIEQARFNLIGIESDARGQVVE